MHILLVTGEYPPQTGGVGAYTAELAHALTDLGVRCTVITSRFALHEQGALAPASSADDAVRVLPIVARWGPRALAAIARRAIDLHADWIHLQYQTAAFNMNPSVNFAPYFWRSKARVAWTFHDLLPAYLFPKAGEGIRNWVTELPVSWAHAVIATNRADYQRLLDHHGGARARLHEIPIGSNVQGVQLSMEERMARRRKYGWGNDQIVLGYFGALNRSKGGMVLLRALSALRDAGIDAHLLMIGDVLGASDPTNADFAQEVRQQVSAMGLDACIQWTGREAAAEVSADLNAVDICLLPYADGASLRRGTLMAALANGCAIVTTAPATPIANLRDGVEALFVPRGDDSQVANATVTAVRRLQEDSTLLATLRGNARTASLTYAWDAIARRHMQVYVTTQ